MSEYCTFQDVVNRTGYKASDLDTFGCEMTQVQFMNLINDYIKSSSNIVNRYCNVKTFSLHDVVDEPHTIQQSDVDAFLNPNYLAYNFMSDYLTYPSRQKLSRIYPRDYPVRSVQSVSVNMKRDSERPVWEVLPEVTEAQDGGWKLIDEGFDMRHVLLTKPLSCVGTNNLKVTYTAGFLPDDEIWSTIKEATILLIINFINYKKRNQEVVSIRGAGVRDFSTMFDTYTANKILTPEVQYMLNMARQRSVDPNMYV